MTKDNDSLTQIVTSSLFVTCMWQSWASGISRVEGSVTLQRILSTPWCYRSLCITPVEFFVKIILKSDTPER